MPEEIQNREEKYRDINWAADYTNLSVPTIRLGVQKGKFPHIRVGRRVLFTRALIDQFFQARAVPVKSKK